MGVRSTQVSSAQTWLLQKFITPSLVNLASSVESQAHQHNGARTISRSWLVAHNPLDTLPLLFGGGTDVAADYAVYARQFSDPYWVYKLLVGYSSSHPLPTRRYSAAVEQHSWTCWQWMYPSPGPAGEPWQRGHVKVSGDVENATHTADMQLSHCVEHRCTITYISIFPKCVVSHVEQQHTANEWQLNFKKRIINKHYSSNEHQEIVSRQLTKWCEWHINKPVEGTGHQVIIEWCTSYLVTGSTKILEI